MKYATWTISRLEGSTPEPLIRSRGGYASGAIMLDDNHVLGYLSDEVNLEDLTKWNVIIKTQEQALNLAQTINPGCFIGDDGTIRALVNN